MELLCIVGPTATGKTRLSVALAQQLGAEIVSCDSMQLYRGMDIGTAKPTAAEMGGVRHHMLDCIDPQEEFSVSRYVELADACVQEILSRGKPVIVVGGTGLYVDSLVAGREFAPFPRTGIREALTLRAQREGIEPLMEQLRAVDPEAAASIHPSNQKRVIRALEVYLETGKTITRHNRETQSRPAKYRPIWIGLDYVNRSALYARIDTRVDEMFAQGLVGEVRRLLENGVSPTATSMQAIGYKELTAFLRGEDTEDAAREKIKLASRRYAKRQRTWFRRNADIHWIALPDAPDFDAVLRQAVEICAGQ
ncbi:MAG: tRNA (adenosine(37)-N6)-dimethylallyltransferase MiaA [Faecousia sp.]